MARLTYRQYVAWRGLRTVGRVLMFGTLAFLFYTAALSWLR